LTNFLFFSIDVGTSLALHQSSRQQRRASRSRTSRRLLLSQQYTRLLLLLLLLRILEVLPLLKVSLEEMRGKRLAPLCDVSFHAPLPALLMNRLCLRAHLSASTKPGRKAYEEISIESPYALANAGVAEHYAAPVYAVANAVPTRRYVGLGHKSLWT
jgi:hypothetical protein